MRYREASTRNTAAAVVVVVVAVPLLLRATLTVQHRHGLTVLSATPLAGSPQFNNQQNPQPVPRLLLVGLTVLSMVSNPQLNELRHLGPVPTLLLVFSARPLFTKAPLNSPPLNNPRLDNPQELRRVPTLLLG